MRNFYLLVIVLSGLVSKGIAQNVITQSDYKYNNNTSLKIDYIPYQHTAFTTINSIGVIGLTVNDAGSDALPTTITGISFSISALTGNALYMAIIYNPTTKIKIDTVLVANGATSIAFTHGTYPSAPNGGSVNLELRVMFKTKVIADNQQMQFTVSSVTAAASGSSLFTAANGGGATSSVAGNINKVNVIANKFIFGQQPTDVYAGQVISPSVTVIAVDKNNNVDSDYTLPIKLDITNSIPSCDTLAGNLVTPVSGIATFPVLNPNVADYAVILTTIGSLTNAVSTAFDVNSAQFKTLINWNFTDNNAGADGGTNSNYAAKTITSTATGAIAYGGCSCIGDHSPAAYSTGWDNGSGSKYWQIDFSTLGYWNIKVSARQRSSLTGPGDFKFQYKVNSNGTWMNLATISSRADSFKTTTVTIPEVDTSHVYVKWLMSSNTSISGGTVDAAGQSFIDDIIVSGTAITLAKQLNYRTKSSGDFESSCNWESTTRPDSIWSQAHGSPDFSAFSIEILPGHTITINQTIRLDQVIVDKGATLILNKGQLYVSGGGSVAGTSGLIVKGTFIDNTSGSNSGLTFNTGNSWKLDSAATFIKTGSSNPRPLRDYFNNGMSSVPSTANWILRYVGANSPAFTTDSSFYPNLTFESTNGSWDPGTATDSYFSGTTAPGAFATIKGNLDIGGTGTGTVKLSNISPNVQPLLVQGNTLIKAGSELNNILNSATGTGFELKGNVTIGGTFTINGGGRGILKMSGSGLQTISGAGALNIQNFSLANTGTGVSAVKNITIGGIDSLILGTLDPGTYTLTLGGPIVKSAGKINGKLNSTIFSGSSLQTLPANTFLDNTLKNITIANNVTLEGLDTITGTLNFSGSNKTLITNGYLTLKSTALATAAVGQIINGNSISGDVTVERYISMKRAWRFLSVPTKTTQTIKAAWQEGATSSGSNLVRKYGTQITNNVAPNLLNGFDYYSADGPSVKKYDITATGTYAPYKGINTAFDSMATRQGIMIFVRGDRTAAGLGAVPTSTTLRTKGPLYIGTLAPLAVSANKFASIGNPYASPLDMRTIVKTPGINNNFYVWDAMLAGAGFGAFQTFTRIGAEYVPTPGGGSYPEQSGGSVVVPYNFIESGQAFFADASNNTGGVVTLTESAKAADGAVTAPVALRSASSTATDALLRTNLYAVEADASANLVDGVLNDFGDYSNLVDNDDALKVSNFAENLGIKTDVKILAVEKRQPVNGNDTIHLNMLKMKAKSYRLEILGKDFDQPGLMATLEDSYTNAHTLINVNGATIYNFTVINVPGSWNPLRFTIVFKQAVVLPVTFSSVKAYQVNKDIAVEWKVENQINIRHYEVERSTDGQHFTNAATVKATGSNGSAVNYQWLDKAASTGNNYYRLASIGFNGETAYSAIIKVVIASNNQQITVYPNPVVEGKINLQFVNQPKGNYSLMLTNKSGQLIMAKQIEHAEGNSIETIQLSGSTAKGTYQLQIITPGNNKTTINVLYN